MAYNYSYMLNSMMVYLKTSDNIPQINSVSKRSPSSMQSMGDILTQWMIRISTPSKYQHVSGLCYLFMQELYGRWHPQPCINKWWLALSPEETGQQNFNLTTNIFIQWNVFENDLQWWRHVMDPSLASLALCVDSALPPQRINNVDLWW